MNKQVNIILEVSKNVMGESLLDPRRLRDNVFKRAVFYKCCDQLTDAGCVEIGRAVGKDHATVLHGIKIFHNDILTGHFPEYLEYYREIISVASKKINKKFSELSTSNDKMVHIMINQRYRIKELESIIEKIPRTIKMKYA